MWMFVAPNAERECGCRRNLWASGSPARIANTSSGRRRPTDRPWRFPHWRRLCAWKSSCRSLQKGAEESAGRLRAAEERAARLQDELAASQASCSRLTEVCPYAVRAEHQASAEQARAPRAEADDGGRELRGAREQLVRLEEEVTLPPAGDRGNHGPAASRRGAGLPAAGRSSGLPGVMPRADGTAWRRRFRARCVGRAGPGANGGGGRDGGSAAGRRGTGLAAAGRTGRLPGVARPSHGTSLDAVRIEHEAAAEHGRALRKESEEQAARLRAIEEQAGRLRDELIASQASCSRLSEQLADAVRAGHQASAEQVQALREKAARHAIRNCARPASSWCASKSRCVY